MQTAVSSQPKSASTTKQQGTMTPLLSHSLPTPPASSTRERTPQQLRYTSVQPVSPSRLPPPPSLITPPPLLLPSVPSISTTQASPHSPVQDLPIRTES